MSSQQQALIADTIIALKKALKRKADGEKPADLRLHKKLTHLGSS
jgi:hypothetical protein